MSAHHHINYLEIPVINLAQSKQFFSTVFNWQFKDYGPQYSCFLDVGIDGGFYETTQSFSLANGSPLIVIYSENLSETQQAITTSGGTISKNIFEFPGGRRFHFLDTNGNEFAVWSE
ncbi:VOC family protein [Shewanella gaetbuli]|uniref:VOC family protein n=1 Tax=Shewanella gaetbuli TaxID=220752 RepID=A0A9X1ZJV8_9GAMM|nr:VOC family protein [Shewanella gaetbuli]MCL1143078.1 VOC family protein [Shewanella gaetbuli]